jgi:basic amino acid/polyamine antiporter, APA family
MEPRFQQLQLQQAMGASQLFTLALGAIVGISWIVLLGDWLNRAGPLGATIAFGCGALVNALVGVCYAELATVLPVSGGEVAYAYRIFGVRTAFSVGWALTLIHIAVISYMALGAAWIIGFLLPDIKGPVLYTFGGAAVYSGSTTVALASVQALSYLNYRGLRTASAFQDVLTYGKLGICVLFIAAGLICGHVANLFPLFRTSGSGVAWRELFGVFVTTLWFYGGFSNIPQVMGERAASTRLADAGRMITLSIGVAGAFYCLLIISAALAVPWQGLVNKELPTAAAFRGAFGSNFFEKAVLLAGLSGAFTSANASLIAATRILFSLGRTRLIGAQFAVIHGSFGSPHVAIVFVGLAASLLVFLGRSGIIPIVGVGSTCYALSYGITCMGVIRTRKARPHMYRPYRVPGGIFTARLATLCVFAMLVLAVYQPYERAKDSFPLEWAILLVWGLMGILVWRIGRKGREASETTGQCSFGEDPRAAV